MSSIIFARLLRAQCNRHLGLSTLDADFAQAGPAHPPRGGQQVIKLLQCHGAEDADWQRCLQQYAELRPGALYCLRGATLAATDGTVLLLGNVHIEPVRHDHGIYLAAAA